MTALTLLKIMQVLMSFLLGTQLMLAYLNIFRLNNYAAAVLNMLGAAICIFALLRTRRSPHSQR